MKAHDKVLLLAELFEADVTMNIQNVLQNIEASGSYQTLLVNVERAKKYKVPYTDEFLTTYDEMKFATISTFRDALIAKATIDHLATISSPKYFINPITYNNQEMKSDINTIEQLPIYIKGKECSVQEMIESSSIETKEKIHAIEDLTNLWRQNAKEVVIDEINNLVKRDDLKHKKNYRTSWSVRSLFMLLLGGNAFLLITLLSQHYVFKNLRLSNKPYVSVICYLVFIGILFIYEVQFLVMNFIKRYRVNERKLCYVYLRNHGKHALKQLEEASFKLRMQLLDSLKDKKIKKISLSKFNYLSNYRRIIIFLNMEDPDVKISKKKSYIQASLIGLLIFSFILLMVLIIACLVTGEMI